MSMYLVFTEGNKRIEKKIPKGKNAEIGRGKGYKIEIRLENKTETVNIIDATVSKKHAKIFWKDGKPYILDLGSKNGTKIDGLMIPGWRRKKESEAVPLTMGAKILFGSMSTASVELEKNTLTLMEGDSFRLSKEELEKIKKEVGVTVKKEEGLHTVEDLKKDVEVKTGDNTTKLSTKDRYKKMMCAYIEMGHLRTAMSGESVNLVSKKWKVIVSQYEDIICDIDKRYYEFIKDMLEESIADGKFPNSTKKDVIQKIEEIQDVLEEAIKLEPQ